MIKQGLKKGIMVKITIFLFLFTLTMPEFFSVVSNYGYYLVLGQFVIVLYLIFTGQYNGKGFSNIQLFIWVGVFDIIMGLYTNLSNGVNFLEGIKQFIVFGLPFYFALGIFGYISSKKDLIIIVKIMLSLVFLQLVFGVLELATGGTSIFDMIFPQVAQLRPHDIKIGQRNILGSIFGFSGDSVFISGAFYSSVLFAHFIIFSPVILFENSFRTISPLKFNYKVLTLFFINIVVIYFSFMRGPLLGVLLALLLFSVKYLFKGLRLAAIISVLIAVIILFFSLYGDVFTDYVSQTQHFDSRYQYWSHYLESFQKFEIQDILFGTHNYNEIALDYGRAAHNAFIIVLVDKGLIFIILFILLMRKFYFVKTNQYLILSIKFTILAFLISQIFDNLLANSILIQTYFYTFIIIGLIPQNIITDEVVENS